MSFTEEQTFIKEQLLADLDANFLKAQAGLVKVTKTLDPGACYTVYYRNENYPKALARYRISANGNNAHAISTLGVIYFNGEGVVRGYFTALERLLKGAELGQTGAGYHLGMMFERGYAVPKDKRKALL